MPAYKYNYLSTQAPHSCMEMINAQEPGLYTQQLQGDVVRLVVGSVVIVFHMMRKDLAY